MPTKKNKNFVNNFPKNNLVIPTICVNTHTHTHLPNSHPPSYYLVFTKIEIAKISIFCKLASTEFIPSEAEGLSHRSVPMIYSLGGFLFLPHQMSPAGGGLASPSSHYVLRLRGWERLRWLRKPTPVPAGHPRQRGITPTANDGRHVGATHASPLQCHVNNRRGEACLAPTAR